MAEYNDVLVEQAENSLRLTEAEAKLNRDMDERARLMAEIAEIEDDGSWRENEDKTEYFYSLGKQVNDLDAEIRKGQKTVQAYQEAWSQSSDAAEDAKEAAEGYADALAKLSGEGKNAAGGLTDVRDSVADAAAAFARDSTWDFAKLGARLGASLGTSPVVDAYREMYSAAHDSISGQMGLFESMAGQVDKYASESEVSLENMTAALESQAAYMSQYAANLQKAAEMGLSEGLLAQLSDGSTESAAYLQAIVDGGQEKIRELNDAFETVAEGKDEFSRTIAQMQTDFGNEMDNMARDAAGAVAEMDLHNEAYAAGLSTMQGYLNAVNGMRGEIAAAAGNVGWGVVNAMNGAISAARSVKIPGHAAGTDSADPGLALVGEQGPELVVFRGGETVLNARETAAVRRSAVAAAPALPAPNSGGITITVAPVYQFSGGASRAQVEDVLQKNNAGLRELVLDALRQIRAEEARRIFA